MRQLTVRASVLLALLLATGAQAQYSPFPHRNRTPREPGGLPSAKIKRTTVSGTIKSIDVEKRTLVLERHKSRRTREVPIDVGPSVIKAGKTPGTFADLAVGDLIRVYGEETVQGGVRAMEITLPRRPAAAPQSGKARNDLSRDPDSRGAKPPADRKTDTGAR